MSDYIAFLRGINLGRRRVTMDVLRVLFEQLKFTSVSTYIASGNVLFSDQSNDEPTLRSRIAYHLADALGYDVDVFLRTPKQLAAMANLQPFAGTEHETPGHVVHAVMLNAPLALAVQRKLLACATPVDHFRFDGCDLYWLCQIRSSDSTVWTSPAMRALKLPSSTMRNMNTIENLHSRCSEAAAASTSSPKAHVRKQPHK